MGGRGCLGHPSPYNCGLTRERIVSGISSNTFREKLLQETDSSLLKDFDVCRTSEVSKRQTESLPEESKSVDYVNKDAQVLVNSRQKGERKKIARRWRKVDQKAVVKVVEQLMHRENAQAFGKFCEKCKTRNHFASQCVSKKDISWKVIKPLNPHYHYLLSKLVTLFD